MAFPVLNFPFRRFLVVDDNPVDTQIITRILTKMELAAQIDSVRNGQEALRYLLARQHTDQYPDVILLDIDMPGIDGFGFLERGVQANLFGKTGVKIVMLTSSISPKDQQRAWGYPIAGFLVKPLTAQGLRSVLQLPGARNKQL